MGRKEYKEFDERQLHTRHKLGNDAFTMLALLLMLDAVLQSFGFVWAPHPTNTFVLLVFCCGVFMVRAIWQGAFAGPKPKRSAANWAGMLTAALLAAFGAIVIIYAHEKQISVPAAKNDSLLLMLVSWLSLAAAGVTHLLRRYLDSKQKDD